MYPTTISPYGPFGRPLRLSGIAGHLRPVKGIPLPLLNVFELVNVVLDEAYSDIPGSEAQKDAAVTHKLKELRPFYGSVWKTGGPSFADPVTRFAYVFAYVTCHANLVTGRIKDCDALSDLMQRPEIDITALGGGPGSDAIGVAKYLQSAGKNPAVQIYLCDREALWGEVWGDIGKKLRSGLTINTTYMPHDATDPKTWEKSKRVFQVDLFTLIYFVSEIYAHRAKVEPYFEHMFKSAKSGAYFLFVDNNSPIFYNWFDGMAAKAGLKIVQQGEEVLKMPSDEQTKALAKYNKKFNAESRLDANASFRVLRKP